MVQGSGPQDVESPSGFRFRVLGFGACTIRVFVVKGCERPRSRSLELMPTSFRHNSCLTMV